MTQQAQEPEKAQKPEPKRCIGCGRMHPINPDGTPEGGALPCGH